MNFFEMVRGNVSSTHLVGIIVKAFKPACLLNPSNSRGVKFGDVHSIEVKYLHLKDTNF